MVLAWVDHLKFEIVASQCRGITRTVVQQPNPNEIAATSFQMETAGSAIDAALQRQITLWPAAERWAQVR